MSPDDQTEGLVRRLRAGERDAAEELDRRFRADLVRFCTGYLGAVDEAEDAVQDVFAKVSALQEIPILDLLGDIAILWALGATIMLLLMGIAKVMPWAPQPIGPDGRSTVLRFAAPDERRAGAPAEGARTHGPAAVGGSLDEG